MAFQCAPSLVHVSSVTMSVGWSVYVLGFVKNIHIYINLGEQRDDMHYISFLVFVIFRIISDL